MIINKCDTCGISEDEIELFPFRFKGYTYYTCVECYHVWKDIKENFKGEKV